MQNNTFQSTVPHHAAAFQPVFYTAFLNGFLVLRVFIILTNSFRSDADLRELAIPRFGNLRNMKRDILRCPETQIIWTSL